MAQTPKSPRKKSGNREVNVRVIERNGNEVRETERTFRIDGMSDPDRDKVVMKLVDSLKAVRKGGPKQHMTIIVEDIDGDRVDRVVTRERIDSDRVRVRPMLPTRPIRPMAPRRCLRLAQSAFPNRHKRTWEFEFRRGTDSLASQLRRFSYQFPRDLDQQLVRPFEEWSRNMSSGSSTIRGLNAYPNNPDHNQLNIRFTAPAKGDVRIVVTNPAGKEIAKRTLNDFSGEFVGQIDLGRNSKGTYFVTVTQREDGAVKRIVVE